MVVRRKKRASDMDAEDPGLRWMRAREARLALEREIAAEREEEGVDEDDAPSTATAASGAPAIAALPAPPPAINARDLTYADYMQRVRDLLGDSAPYLPEVRQPPRHKTDPGVLAAAERDRIDRKRLDEERANKLAATAIDGKTADPRTLRDRLVNDLGLDAHVANMFQPVALSRPERTRLDPETLRRRVDADAEERVRHHMILAARTGVPLDTRTMTEPEVRAYVNLRGLTMNCVEGQATGPRGDS